MQFRPCIDIHNGCVKQIVGSSLTDENDRAKENFVASKDAAFFASLYKKDGLKGGHIILLNAADSLYYEKTKAQALAALKAYPKGMQVGGGIGLHNAEEFLKAGASHVIVTSCVFHDGAIHWETLEKLKNLVGKERIVLDLSCKKKDNQYYIVTDRWQHFTEEALNVELMDKLSDYAGEYLVHAVDVEGKNAGIEKNLITLLGSFTKLPITYAGGVHNFSDLEMLRTLGNDRLDVTIGSALDLFGGNMPYQEVLKFVRGERQ